MSKGAAVVENDSEKQHSLLDDGNGEEQLGVAPGDKEIIDDDLDDEPQLTAHEVKAMDKGWTSKEDWVAAGNNADEWRTAKDFNEFGDMNRRLKDQDLRFERQEKNHGQQIGNLNLMHRKELEFKEEEIAAKLEKAVDDGDTEGAAALLEQQKDLTTQKAGMAGGDAPKETNQDMAVMKGEWEENNQWAFEESAKARAANSSFQLARAKGMSMADTLSYVDERMENFDEQNPSDGKQRGKVNQNRRRAANSSAGGGAGGGGGKKRGLSMDDCSESEMKFRRLYADGEAGDKIFLQTIANNRKGG